MSDVAEFQDQTKHDAILSCATKIFAEKGFRNTDVQQIADQAGVGKGTVYRYFGNKEQLFLAVADAGMKQLEQQVFAAIDGVEGLQDVIRAGALAYAAFFQKHPELVEILIQERAEFRGSIPDTHLVYREKNRGVFEQILRRGIAAGEVRDDIHVRLATDAMVNVLYGTVVCGCLEGASRRIRKMAEQAVEIYLRGILNDPR